jgi:hypothetical protein
MRLYTAFDLHSSNSYLGIVDETGKRVFKRKLPNDPEMILAVLSPYKLPGEEALYKWIGSVLDAAAKDPEVMKTLRETAFAADKELVADSEEHPYNFQLLHKKADIFTLLRVGHYYFALTYPVDGIDSAMKQAYIRRIIPFKRIPIYVFFREFLESINYWISKPNGSTPC